MTIFESIQDGRFFARLYQKLLQTFDRKICLNSLANRHISTLWILVKLVLIVIVFKIAKECSSVDQAEETSSRGAREKQTVEWESLPTWENNIWHHQENQRRIALIYFRAWPWRLMLLKDDSLRSEQAWFMVIGTVIRSVEACSIISAVIVVIERFSDGTSTPTYNKMKGLHLISIHCTFRSVKFSCFRKELNRVNLKLSFPK